MDKTSKIREIKVSQIYLLLLLVFTCSTYAKSIQPKFDQYTIKEGLSHNTVNCIAQDSLGFMWFGTMDGLNRFDGYTFKIIKTVPDNPNSLCHNMIKSICIDKEGEMWIGTARGLSHLNIETGQFTNFYADDSSSLSHNNIEMVYCDNIGYIWIATMGGGLNCFNKETQQFNHFKSDKKQAGNLSNDNVHWIFEDSDSTLWIGTEGGGLNRFNKQTQTFDFFQFEPEHGNYQSLNCIRSIQEDSNENIWVGTWGGGAAYISKLGGKFKYFRQSDNPKQGVSDSRIISLLSADDGQMWLGTEDGGLNRFVFNHQTFEHIPFDPISPKGLKSNTIKSIFQDQTKRIWMGSSGGGVFSFRYENLDFSKLTIDNKNIGQTKKLDIYAIEGDKESLTIGTNGQGLYYATLPDLNNDSSSADTSLQFKKIPLNSDIIHALCYDNWGRLWAGTLGGGLKLIEFSEDATTQPKIKTFGIHEDTHHSVSYNDIRTLMTDRIGNIWIGTAGGGLDKLIVNKRGEYYFEHYKHNPERTTSISNNDIRAITEDNNGHIWVGTSHGLNKIVTSTHGINFQSYYSDLNKTGTLSGNWINALYADSDGLLWIGTDAGLNTLNIATNEITVYTEKDGLVNNVIKSIESDMQGNLWITTVNGLSMFNQEANSFYNFYESDGLLSNEFNVGATYSDPSGKIFLGGTMGLNYFKPKNILKQNQVSALYLTDFKMFNQSIQVGETINGRILLQHEITSLQEIRLKSNENSFSFKFSALDYSNAEKITYQYKLEGFNKDWQETSSSHRFATYTNLGGGNYTFKVKAMTGVPGDDVFECTINLKIDYPIWWRWWSFIIYIGLLLTISYVVYNYYHNKMVYRDKLRASLLQREKEQELNRLKQRFFMNISHDLKTPLTLITGPLNRISQSQSLSHELKPAFHLMEKNAMRLSRLINQLMDYNKQERGALKLQVREIDVIPFTQNILSSFDELAQQKQIELKLVSSHKELVTYIDEDKIEKVIVNLLSNALKHTPPHGSISVVIKENTDEYINIEVNDTGAGIDAIHHEHLFERFYQVQDDGINTGAGIGLSLVKDFIELHHGTVSLKSELGKGSHFRFQIPQSVSAYSDDIKIHKQHSTEITPPLNKDITPNIDKNKPSQPTILVVEDNSDMQTYMHMILSDTYNVLQAYDGAQGWKMALETTPNIIISDVMMPIMDGITFCNKIKTDLTVSHIPVLLLTAKSGKENTLLGLESGAADYIEKPFDTDILLARLQAMLSLRTHIRQQIQQTTVCNIPENGLSQIDRKFLEKIELIVKQNMTSDDFSVEELGRKLGMSRTTLYRKIKNLLNQTPIEYLRSIRLKEALSLIQNGNEDIINIAESVGFKDIAYFKRCFKKQFNDLPKELKHLI